jgi:hypothetical protein
VIVAIPAVEATEIIFPTKFSCDTLFAPPTIIPSSLMVRPVIASAGAAGTQDGAFVPPFA